MTIDQLKIDQFANKLMIFNPLCKLNEKFENNELIHGQFDLKSKKFEGLFKHINFFLISSQF